MLKITHLESRFPSTGEATVQPVVLWANGRPCYEGISKHASVGSDYFKSIVPVPGHSIVYVLAMGAWETYGENRNGDSFPEFPYKENEDPPWIAPNEVLTQHYKTFETHAHNYRHHVNKDPKKAVGKVMKAFWNPLMHRVELLIDLDDEKAPDLAQRIAAGEFPPVSMGTRVKYDVCSICGNRAPTRKHYCKHLKFQMRDVIDGMKVSALNPSPRFFDISWVYRPADQTAFMLKKVAEDIYDVISGGSAGEYIEDMERQKYAARKLAVIDKVVQGIPVDAKTEGVDPVELSNLCKMRGFVLEAGRNTPDLPDNILRTLSRFSLPKVFSSTLASGGMLLSTPEVTKIVIYKSRPKMNVPGDLLDKSVAVQGSVLDLFQDFPNILDQLKKTGSLDIGPEYVESTIVDTVSPFMEKRSGIPEYLKRRFVPESWREETPYTTPLTIRDPVSGHGYGTTRGAAIRAHDEIAKRNLYKVLGGAALLGGAYKLIGGGLDYKGWGKYKPLAALALGALGVSQWPSMGKHYQTEQGVPIPVSTEIAKLSAAPSSSLTTMALPIFGTLGLMAALSHDYQSRLKSGIPIGYEGQPLSRRMLDKLEQFAHEHPLITGATGVIAGRRLGRTAPAQFLAQKGQQLFQPLKETVKSVGHGAKETLEGLTRGVKISSYLQSEMSPEGSTVMLPDVDLDKVAEWLGWVIVEG